MFTVSDSASRLGIVVARKRPKDCRSSPYGSPRCSRFMGAIFLRKIHGPLVQKAGPLVRKAEQAVGYL